MAQIGPMLVRSYLEAIQDQVLDGALGGKWIRGAGEAPWTCPRCRSGKGFRRRGSRTRVVRKSSVGRVSFRVRQVTCRGCGKTFSPLLPMLGLGPYQVSTGEFQAKAVKVACQTSFARCSAHMSELAGAEVSASAVHKWVQQTSKMVVLDVGRAHGRPVLLDSTNVRATDRKTGCSLNIGLSILGRYWRNGRTRLRAYPVCFGVNEQCIKTAQPLALVKPARILFDRDDGLVDWLEDTFPDVPKQRCVWHLVTQLYRTLWRDGLRKPQSRMWTESLSQIMYHPEGDVESSRRELKGLIVQLAQHNLKYAANYLKAAEPYAFAYRQHPDGMFFEESNGEARAICSTSPVEREIREINRRTDIGARWSTDGVHNLVLLDLVRRYDLEQWNSLWHLSNGFAGTVTVEETSPRVGTQPGENVKTS